MSFSDYYLLNENNLESDEESRMSNQRPHPDTPPSEHGAQRGLQKKVILPDVQPSPAADPLQLIAETLQRLSVQVNSNQGITRWQRQPPTFHGHEEECPEAFLRELEDYFHDERVPDEHWKPILLQQLRGEAATWMKTYSQTQTTYGFLTSRLVDHYNHHSTLDKLTAKFYGSLQRDEPVDQFIMKKMALANRIFPQMSRPAMTRTLIEQLRPEIRCQLRTAAPTNIEDLLRVAQDIERDLALSSRTRQQVTSRQPMPRSQPMTRNQPPRDRSPPRPRQRSPPRPRQPSRARSPPRARSPSRNRSPPRQRQPSRAPSTSRQQSGNEQRGAH